MYPSFSTLSHLAWPGASQCVREEIKGKQLTVRRPCDGRLERICLEKTCIFVNEMVLLILMFMKKKPAPLHPALAGMYKNHCLKRKQNVLDKLFLSSLVFPLSMVKLDWHKTFINSPFGNETFGSKKIDWNQNGFEDP